MIKEIITTVKMTQNKVYLDQDVIKKFGFKDKDRLVWCINENNELVLIKSDKINKDSTLIGMY